MQNLTLTARMVRDVLALQGPKSLGELHETINADKNLIQAYLLELASAGEVSYDYETGTWGSDVVLQ
jgi:hypothetical protein